MMPTITFLLRLKLLLVISILLLPPVANARFNDHVDDELYQKLIDGIASEKEQEKKEQEYSRLLIRQQQAAEGEVNTTNSSSTTSAINDLGDGLLGSRCNMLNPCRNGYDCIRRRCIPNRSCIKERMNEFTKSFDSEVYKQRMYQSTGITQDDVFVAYRESNGNEESFVQSNTMQSLIDYMKHNSHPFDQITDIVDSCSGVVDSTRRHRGRRRLLENDIDKEDEESTQKDTDNNNNYQGTRRLSSSTTTPAPSSSPTLSQAPSISDEPSNVPSMPPTGGPSLAPTTPRGSTFFLGLHVEGGFIFEGSVTVAWKDLDFNTDTFIRTCIGAEIGGGSEVSLYVAITFDGLDNGWGCASTLIDADLGLGLYVGSGFGACYARTTSVYLEFTLGVGIGAGIGWSICGMCVLPVNGGQH